MEEPKMTLCKAVSSFSSDIFTTGTFSDTHKDALCMSKWTSIINNCHYLWEISESWGLWTVTSNRLRNIGVIDLQRLFHKIISSLDQMGENMCHFLFAGNYSDFVYGSHFLRSQWFFAIRPGDQQYIGVQIYIFSLTDTNQEQIYQAVKYIKFKGF